LLGITLRAKITKSIFTKVRLHHTLKWV